MVLCYTEGDHNKFRIFKSERGATNQEQDHNVGNRRVCRSGHPPRDHPPRDRDHGLKTTPLVTKSVDAIHIRAY